MTISKLVALTLVACVALAPSRSADAQLGSLIRKKVTEAVKKPDKEADAKKADAKKADAEAKKGEAKGGFVGGNSSWLEITPPVFEQVIRGLQSEVALTKEFRAELAKYPSREQRQKCETAWAQSPEAQKLVLGFSVPQNVTAEQATAAVNRHSQEMMDAVRKKCPADAEMVWPDSKRAERMQEIRKKAVETAGLAGSDPNEPVDQMYGILLERSERLCKQVKASGQMSGAIKIPGQGQDIYWVFTPTEAATLTPANCQRMNNEVSQLV